MRLTSYNRILLALGDGENALTDTVGHRRRFLSTIHSISNRVEQFLNRNLELKSYTEFRDALPLTVEYFLQSQPVTTVASVHQDSTGLYDGSEVAETLFYINKDSDGVVLDSPVTPAKRGLRFIYTGGLAVHGTHSTYKLVGTPSTLFVVGKYVRGKDSLAVGLVVSNVTDVLVIEVLYGVYEIGEVVEGFDDESGGTAISGMTETLLSATTLSLAESFPDIVHATELEIRFMDDHRSDFENIGSSKSGTTRVNIMQNEKFKRDYDLLPEVRSLLEAYRNITI